MSDSLRHLRVALLLSPLLLTSCDTLNLSKIDLSSIDIPWFGAHDKAPPPQTAVALRQDASEATPPPDGMQKDSEPFGDARTANAP
ncbi:MAG TPA: hypothetical protein VGG48_11740 [Rhizomicrobium sp.]|jgi:hypothetical protein